MPELPEVETIVRALRDGGRGQPPMLGRTIADARFLWKRTLAFPSEYKFRKAVKQARIESIDRRGKFIVLSLSRNYLLIHLRMSGDLRVEKSPDANIRKNANQPHDRCILKFEDGWRLAFNDARKFGRVWLVADADEILGHLGPEPFSKELTPLLFYEMLSARSRQLKSLLLDQTFLAGLGNIYTDEALHRAGLHPLMPTNRISKKQSEVLLASIREVLQEGIQRNGASIDWVYRGGDFQNHFFVYQRQGESCRKCGATIQRITVGQRGTHFCPVCQPESPDFH